MGFIGLGQHGLAPGSPIQCLVYISSGASHVGDSSFPGSPYEAAPTGRVVCRRRLKPLLALIMSTRALHQCRELSSLPKGYLYANQRHSHMLEGLAGVRSSRARCQSRTYEQCRKYAQNLVRAIRECPADFMRVRHVS